MDDTFETLFEDKLDTVPEEVINFLFGEGLATALEAINALIEKEEDRVMIEKEILLFVVGEHTTEELAESIAALPIPDEKKDEVLALIKVNFVDELLTLVEIHDELEKKITPVTPALAEKKDTPRSPQMFDALKQRLTEAKTIAPIAKQGIGIVGESKKEASVPGRIDPYRELPR